MRVNLWERIELVQLIQCTQIVSFSYLISEFHFIFPENPYVNGAIACICTHVNACRKNFLTKQC